MTTTNANPASREPDPTGAAAALLSDIGDEVFEKTGGDLWRAGQPLQGSPDVQPSPKATEQEDKSAADGKQTKESEATSDGKEKLIAGKWKTVEEAEKGIHELIKLAKTTIAERDQYRQQLEEIREKPEQKKGSQEPLDPVSELEQVTAIPNEIFRKAVRAEAQNLIADMLKPAIENEKADKEVLKIFPKFKEELPEILEFLEKNPEIKKDVEYAESKGQYLMARKYAYTMFNAQREVVNKEKTETKAKTHKDKVAETLPDAGLLPGSGSGGVATTEEGDWPNQKRMAELKELARQGHADPLWRATIGKMLDRQGWPNA